MLPLSYVIGDATLPQGKGDKIIVHVCNDIGKWGRGFVMALSKRWPITRREYLAWYQGKRAIPFKLGEVQYVQVENDIWIANTIGQHGVRRFRNKPPVRYKAIRQALQKVADKADELDATIHMPRIGSGLAGGKWDLIEQIIFQELSGKGCHVTVYDLPSS